MKDSQSLEKFDSAVLDVCEGNEGVMGITGSSSSDDDISSEEFIITSDSDVEVEKEVQEEAAYEGVRCLLGNGTNEFEGDKRLEHIQVLNQPNHSGAQVNHSGEVGGSFLSALNIKLVKTDSETLCDKSGAGPSFTKRSGARELRNLVSNVNYEKALRGKGKIRYQ